MSTASNPARSKRGLQASKPRLAFWLESTSLPACEIAALLGYDIVVFDLEHGVIPDDIADTLSLCCKRLGLTVFSRLAGSDRTAVQRALDSGVDGIILPQIQNLEHARAVTLFAKYPPLGSRGIGYNRTTGFGGTDPEFFVNENRRTVCMPMIETPGALADAAGIAALATVDGLFVGPSDLSLTRGRGPYRGTDADFADMTGIGAAAKGAGKTWALPATDDAAYQFAARHKASFVTVSDDLTALRIGLAKGLEVGAGRERG